MAAGVSWYWKVSPRVIGRNIATRKGQAMEAFGALGETHAARLQTRVKQRSRWNDRTTNARQGIGAEAQVNGAVIDVIVFHVEDYGPYLELGTSKMPKLGVMAEEIVVTMYEMTADAQQVLRRLFG